MPNTVRCGSRHLATTITTMPWSQTSWAGYINLVVAVPEAQRQLVHWPAMNTYQFKSIVNTCRLIALHLAGSCSSNSRLKQSRSPELLLYPSVIIPNYLPIGVQLGVSHLTLTIAKDKSLGHQGKIKPSSASCDHALKAQQNNPPQPTLSTMSSKCNIPHKEIDGPWLRQDNQASLISHTNKLIQTIKEGSQIT